MNRWVLPAIGWLLVLAGCAPEPEVDLSERDVAQLQRMMEDGELTSRQLVEFYLERIETLDHDGPELRSIIEINPDALDIADALDAERRESGSRGPLHGIPVVLKANIDTGDRMSTTAGSLALADHRAPDDAFIVSRLREAGAVIMAKANLSEWANMRSSNSSSGWSSIGGQTRNPYDPRRNPCGSSSGSAVAVAANLATLAVGTETNGSVVCPSSANGIVGIKPTIGLVSRDGIIPIAHSQDTAGPMARTVRDAALMLSAMSATDEADAAMADRPEVDTDYAYGLSTDGLKGKRIGVIRSHYGAGRYPHVEKMLEQTVATLKAQGAEIIDPIEIDTTGMSDASGQVLYYEFKEDLRVYLEQSGATMNDLAEIIAFNEINSDTVMPIFGQDILLDSQAMGPLTDEEYLAALADSKRIARAGIDNALEENNLDALIAPTNGPAWLTDHINGDAFQLASSSYAAVSGYANITVPAGFAAGLPLGISFMGGPYSEKSLIGMAYAFEQASRVRRAPQLD